MKYVPTNDVYRLQLNVCIQDEWNVKYA
jgi:hypothetical protein